MNNMKFELTFFYIANHNLFLFLRYSSYFLHLFHTCVLCFLLLLFTQSNPFPPSFFHVLNLTSLYNLHVLRVYSGISLTLKSRNRYALLKIFVLFYILVDLISDIFIFSFCSAIDIESIISGICYFL
jgi:hypothetical protein